MSQSTDPGHFFQSEAALAIAARKAAKASNTLGDPITATSKILAVLPDPTNRSRIYIAESGGLARRIDLETNDKSFAFKNGHTAPITSLALSPKGDILYTGSWDKTILAWSTKTREILTRFAGHADFVKSLLYIPSEPPLLLSGSSDATISIWSPTSGKRLSVLKGHTRAIGTLALDPIASTPEEVVVYAGGSEREIRIWRINVKEVAEGNTKSAVEEGKIGVHETSVHKIRFEGEEADCWTASADGTARRVDVRTVEMKEAQRTEMELKHADFVNDVCVEPMGRWVITACRDEGVRVWDIASGELYHNFDGHSEEVTGLVVVGRGDMVVSVGIDCTIRRWSLKAEDLKRAKEEALSGPKVEVEEKKKEGLMTVEEEAELAELMEDSD